MQSCSGISDTFKGKLLVVQVEGWFSCRGPAGWNHLGSFWNLRWFGRVWFPLWRSWVFLAFEAAQLNGKPSRETGLFLYCKTKRQMRISALLYTSSFAKYVHSNMTILTLTQCFLSQKISPESMRICLKTSCYAMMDDIYCNTWR